MWQHDGNEKSNSPYLMDNTDNVNPTSENTKAKLFKLCFSGANGNNKINISGERVKKGEEIIKYIKK